MAKNDNSPVVLIRSLLTAALIAIGAISLPVLILLILMAGGMRETWIASIVMVLGFLLLPLGLGVLGLLGYLLIVNRSAVDHAVGHLERMEDVLLAHGESLRTLASLSVLSDQAKSLVYHEQELEALREMINAMLMRQDHKSADALIDRMELQMGLVEEATRLRDHIDSTKRASMDEKIDAAIHRIHEILDRREWAQALRESKRLISLFPDNQKITNLPKQIQAARNAHKGKLLKEYGEAVRVNDVERSIDLLKELDKYLTPQEGAALSESARDVFKKKLHNLGVQFAIAVADQQWAKAVTTGEEIIKEYPNSRMSREVREKIDVLRDYAAGRPPVTSIIDMPDATGAIS